MNDITVIMTYYGQINHLIYHCKFFASLPEKYRKHVRVIFINDGYNDNGMFGEILQKFENEFNMSAYAVTEDVGFNSHGCRNLGMLKSDTLWNLLIDMDTYFSQELFIDVITREVDPNIFYVFKVDSAKNEDIDKYDHHDPKKILKYVAHPNVWLITKPCFWSSGGYDVELTGLRYGDGEFFMSIDHDKYTHEVWHPDFGDDYDSESYPEVKLQTPNRGGSYINQSIERGGHIDTIVDFITKRNEDKERKLKKRLISFQWVQLI